MQSPVPYYKFNQLTVNVLHMVHIQIAYILLRVLPLYSLSLRLLLIYTISCVGLCMFVVVVFVMCVCVFVLAVAHIKRSRNDFICDFIFNFKYFKFKYISQNCLGLLQSLRWMYAGSPHPSHSPPPPPAFLLESLLNLLVVVVAAVLVVFAFDFYLVSLFICDFRC